MTILEKIGLYAGVFLTLVLVALIFFSKNGVMDYRRLTEKEQALSQRLHQVERENRRIENQIRSLQQDMDYLRHLARHEHGMAAPDEIIFKETPSETIAPASTNPTEKGTAADGQ